MKLFVIFAVILGVAFGDNFNWNSVKPLAEYPEFWGSDVEASNRFIVGGSYAEVHQFPFHVAIVSGLEFGSALCSGSLISRQAVLTSASCVAGANNVTLHLGARDLNIDERYHARFTVRSSNIRVHPAFSRLHRVLLNDVAVVRLTHPIAFFPAGVNVINLPSNADMTNDFAGNIVIIMGFGRVTWNRHESAYISRFSHVSTINNEVCRRRSSSINVEDQHICTDGNDGQSLCTGSLGGPMIIERNGQSVQIGVGSFYSGNCARNDPSGFVRITHRPIYDWIRANM